MSAENDDQDRAERAFEERAKADLRKMVDEIPPAVRERLAHMAAAAAREPRGRVRRVPRLIVPLAAATTLSALVALVLTTRAPQPPPAPVKSTPTSADDFALLLNVDNLDLLEQMEFYQWLDREARILDGDDASVESQRS